jgi:hypothetical protein
LNIAIENCFLFGGIIGYHHKLGVEDSCYTFDEKYCRMKKLLLLLSIALAGCGPKTNEDIAKDLITERLKSQLA